VNFSVLTKSLRSGEKKGFLALYIYIYIPHLPVGASRVLSLKDPYPSPKNRRFDGQKSNPTIGLVRVNPEILGHTWILRV